MRSYKHLDPVDLETFRTLIADIDAGIEEHDRWRAKHLREEHEIGFLVMYDEISEWIGCLFGIAEDRGRFLTLLKRKATWFIEPVERCRIEDPNVILDLYLTAIAANVADAEAEYRYMIKRGRIVREDADLIHPQAEVAEAFMAILDGRGEDAVSHCHNIEDLWSGRRTTRIEAKSAATIAFLLKALHNRNAQDFRKAMQFRQRFIESRLNRNAMHDASCADLFDVASQAALQVAQLFNIKCEAFPFADPQMLP
jgi:hypothetical protein